MNQVAAAHGRLHLQHRRRLLSDSRLLKRLAMPKLIEYFVYKAPGLMALVAGASTVTLVLVLWGLSAVESRRNRPTPFELEVRPLGDAPLWVVLVAGLLVLNGLAMVRWAIISAEVGHHRDQRAYEVVVPLPLGKVTAINFLYVGLAVLVFYLSRGALH